MTPRKILILEDNTSLRLSLAALLRDRGFEVEAAHNVRSAHDSIRRMEGKIDVALLDMKLEDAEDSTFTGADVGMEIRERQPDTPPEFLIYSVYPDVTDYLKKALRLGVAAYLNKLQVDALEVISYVRVLALRRSLSLWNEPLIERIQRIAENAKEEAEAIVAFCREILRPQVDSILGTSAVLLLTDNRARDKALQWTMAFSCGLDLPERGIGVYASIQDLLFLPGTYGRCQILERGLMTKMEFKDEEGVLEKLVDAHFIPLAAKGGFRLSLGVLPVSRETNHRAENPKVIVPLINLFLRDSVVYHLLHVAELWAQAEVRKSRLSEETGSLFLNVGREQLTILEDAARAGEIARSDALVHIPKLQMLGEDLRDAGEALRNLGEDQAAGHRVEVAALTRQVWAVVASLHEIAALELLEVRGELWAECSGERLYAILSRVLGWFAERLPETGGAPKIVVTLAPDEGHGLIIIEDSSPRIIATLRRHLFDPFALGGWRTSLASWRAGRRLSLYLAKLLLESQSGSFLEDRTDKMPGEQGHRLVMRLPLAE